MLLLLLLLKHFWFPFPFYFILGSLRCHVGDGNKNVKQTNKHSSSFRLAKRKLNFARAAHFLVHFFVVSKRLRRKISCFMENVGKRWWISLSFDEFRYPIFDIQLIFCNITPGEFAYIWRSEPVGMMAFKFQRTRSHFSTNISSMRRSVSSPDEILRRELKIQHAVEYFWRTSRCFIWWWITVSNAWYYFSNELILEGEIKDAKMSSFSSDLQTLIKRLNFLCIFFMNY